MESDELSMEETTMPTDFSVSADEISELETLREARKKEKHRVGRNLLEKKQLQHDLQVLRIELTQKSLLVDNLKADFMQKTEELEENLGNALHEKQILQARLESQLKIQAEEARRRQETIQKEMDTILKRQRNLEITNEKLQERAGDIKRSLIDFEITENQYVDFRSKNQEDLSLRDFMACKVFETLRPWKLENEELKTRVKVTTEELRRCVTELERCEEAYKDERAAHTTLQMGQQKLTLAYAELKNQVQQGNYKTENYDRVKRERDELEQECIDLRKRLGYTDASNVALTNERDEYNNELSGCKQSLALLKQDKDYLSKQLTESQTKLMYADEKVIQLNDQLERAKQSREELYDKYVASRDQYKSEYETKLRDELEQIRVRTNTEIDRLKTSTREMYERENRGLREARDMALQERDRALQMEKDASLKHDQLLQEYRQYQSHEDSRHSELNNQIKLRAFETERTQLVYEETVKSLKEAQVEAEKYQRKLEVLTKEYFTLQTSLEKQVSELEATVTEKNNKLESYEKLEQELDQVIMQAADVDDEGDAEKVLFSYGYGANVPTTARRRLKQSVHLARRVLQLERTNTELTKEIEKQQIKNKELANQLKDANKILDESQQPYHYLVESIRLRDSQINKQKDLIEALESDVEKRSEKLKEIIKAKNMMATDLERLLNQKEELSVMKQVIRNMSLNPSKTPVEGLTKNIPKVNKTNKLTGTSHLTRGLGTAVRQTAIPFREPYDDDENISTPPPTEFTSSERRLNQKFQRPSRDRHDVRAALKS